MLQHSVIANSVTAAGPNAEADLGLLQHPRWSVKYSHKALHLSFSNPRSASNMLTSEIDFSSGFSSPKR